jgi:hypothetical protein
MADQMSRGDVIVGNAGHDFWMNYTVKPSVGGRAHTSLHHLW